MKPGKLLLPGIFALVLGIGNITVGSLRVQEHLDIIAELSSVPPLPPAAESSPLMRIQLTEPSQEGLRQRLATAQQRVGFYQLVEYGGRVLSTIGLILTVLSWFVSGSRPTEGEETR